MSLERIVKIRGAYDKRHQDPNKNYGVHGMEILFVVKGPHGAMQFLVYTAMHLPHVRDWLWENSRGREFNPFEPIGADIGYHAKVPQYEGQTCQSQNCEWTGGPCYYDGTSLGASEFMPTFLAEGDAAVWAMLERRYHERFVEAEDRTTADDGGER